MQLDVIQIDPVPATAPSAPKPCCAKHEAGSLGWTCPMHPDVTSGSPGNCPFCGMNLEPIGAAAAMKTGGATVSSLRVVHQGSAPRSVLDLEARRLGYINA